MGVHRRRLLLGAAASAAAFTVLAVLVATQWTPLRRLDVSVANSLNAWVAASTALTTFWKVVTYGLEPLTFEVVAVVAAVLLWWRAGRRKLAVFVVVTIFGVLGLYDLVKVLVGRARPVVPVPLIVAHGASFPSGHAAMSFTGMALLVLLVGRRLHSTAAVAALAFGAALVAATVAFSRLALGAHFLSDVIGSWLLAATWLLCMWAAFDIGAERAGPLSPRSSPAAPRALDQPRGGSSA
ncbi:MAG TPA: phosphatase PAP2 family protein [Jatrophihabitans sp.]|nr:phosphatase PAP2 family protein [Jatrophihabitans sp.]